MSSQRIVKAPVITHAVVQAAIQRARVERALAVRAVFAGLFQALRRLGAAGPVDTISAAAR